MEGGDGVGTAHEEAKGLRGAAGVPLSAPLGSACPGLQHCGPGGTGQSGQRPCPSAARPGSGRAKTDASWKNICQERSQARCSQPETVNGLRGRAGPPTTMRSPRPAPIPLQSSSSPRSVWQQRSREPRLRVRAAAAKPPARVRREKHRGASEHVGSGTFPASPAQPPSPVPDAPCSAPSWVFLPT